MSAASQKWYYEHLDEMRKKNREYQRIYREKHSLTEEEKEEKKRIREEYKKNYKQEIIKSLELNKYINITNNNKATLYKDKGGMWWYYLKYSNGEVYISEKFDKKYLAVNDLKLAI